VAVEYYIDDLQQFADERFRSELVAARVEYFAALGKVNEDDEFFEAHLDRFLDWFLFERDLAASGEPVLPTFIAQIGAELSEERYAVFEGFLKNIHSLFQIKKVGKAGLQIRDLLTKASYFVASDVPAAFTKGQIFEARLLPVDDQWQFSRGYIFHPSTANKAILKRVKKIDVADSITCRSFIRELAICRLRSDRYKHVDATQFYTFD
jgi:hypothetical protein